VAPTFQPTKARVIVGYWENWDSSPPATWMPLNTVNSKYNVLIVAFPSFPGDGSVSLAQTVCLGYCHASPAVRVGDTIDAGPGVIDRVLAGTERPAPEPRIASTLDAPVLTEPGDWSGLRHALDTLSATELLEAVEAAAIRGRGGAGFPAGTKWRFMRDAPGAERFIVANGDEGDPGSYIDKVLMEDNPALLLEGMALAGYATGAAHGFVLTRSEYPRSKPALDAAAAEARAQGLLGDDIRQRLRSTSPSSRAPAPTSSARRPRCSPASRPAGTVVGPPAVPAERGVYGSRPSSTTSRRCNILHRPTQGRCTKR
jgi:formate dehydrogenase iron-sulfur subunit